MENLNKQLEIIVKAQEFFEMLIYQLKEIQQIRHFKSFQGY